MIGAFLPVRAVRVSAGVLLALPMVLCAQPVTNTPSTAARTARRVTMPAGLATNMTRVGADRNEIPIKKPDVPKAVIPDLKPDEPLITVNGTSISWGSMRRYAELLTSDFELPVGVTAADFEEQRDNILMRHVYKLASSFIAKTVLAQEAARHGLTVEEAALADKQAQLATQIRKSGAKKEAYVKEITVPGSFLWYEVKQALLVSRLTQEIIRPVVKVTDEDVKQYQQERKKENAEIVAYNQSLRPRAEKLLATIKSGEATFAEVAFRESDCGSSVDYGEWGILKREQLRPELAEVAFNMNEGALSDVIETPFSFHILKLNKKNPGFLKAGEKGPAPVISVNLAHIMLEKKELKPELTAEEARNDLLESRTQQTLADLRIKLIKEAKIETPLKLFAETEAKAAKPQNVKK